MSWQLHLGDCLDPVSGLASLPDKSVDHVICDPPYAAQTHKGARSCRDVDSPSIDFAHIDAETLHRALYECGRIARRWVIATLDWRHLGMMEVQPPQCLRFVRFGIWIKPNGAPQFTGDRPATGWEAVAILHASGPGKMRWNGGGNRAVWTCNIEQGEHPTQKPLPLLETWVTDFTDSGETILDPFSGSGTTGVACIRLGRNFIGWEKDPKYHAAAVRRLQGTREQLGLLERPRTKAKQGSLL